MKYFVKPRYKVSRTFPDGRTQNYIYGQFSKYEDVDALLKDLKIMIEKGMASGDAIIIEFAGEKEGDENGES